MIKSSAHVFVDNLRNLSLSDVDAHHLSVLRLRDGEVVSVSDGKGSWQSCLYRAGGLEVAGVPQTVPEPSPKITICFSMLKGDRNELVVQKLTEIGVDTIIPMITDRTVAKVDKSKYESLLLRFQRIAREASMQSRRVWLPTVAPISKLQEGVRADFDGPPLTLATPTILIGPEGGWSLEEQAARLQAVSLGSTVLRGETAAIAAGVLLAAAREQQVV